MTSNFDKRRDLINLLGLYDTAITRHKVLLDKTIKGKFKSTQVSDEILYALVKGDLKLMEDTREQLQKDLQKITTTNGIDKPNSITESGDN